MGKIKNNVLIIYIILIAIFLVGYLRNDDDEYEVTLSNNIKIDFDKRGRWKSITANVSLPLEILPVQAREYLEANYKTKMERKKEERWKSYKYDFQFSSLPIFL